MRSTTSRTNESPRQARRICFVAPTTYPELSGDRSLRMVGGAQVQQCIIARELVRRGYDVSMVCLDYGQPDGVVIDGIKVHRAHKPDEGLPVLRFVHPRMTSMMNAMKRADADVYYQRTAGALGGMVVAYARLLGRRSVYAGASDRDFFPDVPHVKFARDRAIHRWALRHADFVIAQTEAQRLLCERNYRRSPDVIRSCYGHRGAPANFAGAIIWVGNVIPVKRAELFVDLAKVLPQFEFKLIGGDDRDLVPLRQRAADARNIDFTGFVPFADIEAHFDGPSLLVNTSSNEGFPNTFLQAWSRAMPTVSFFDPGATIDGAVVGTVVSSFDELAAAVVQLKHEQDRWSMQGQAAKRYFEKTFSVAPIASSYERLLFGAERGAIHSGPVSELA